MTKEEAAKKFCHKIGMSPDRGFGDAVYLDLDGHIITPERCFLAGYEAAKPQWNKFSMEDTDSWPPFGERIITLFNDGQAEVCSAREMDFDDNGTVTLELISEDDALWDLESVTHWMPLPELPKEEK